MVIFHRYVNVYQRVYVSFLSRSQLGWSLRCPAGWTSAPYCHIAVNQWPSGGSMTPSSRSSGTMKRLGMQRCPILSWKWMETDLHHWEVQDPEKQTRQSNTEPKPTSFEKALYDPIPRYHVTKTKLNYPYTNLNSPWANPNLCWNLVRTSTLEQI